LVAGACIYNPFAVRHRYAPYASDKASPLRATPERAAVALRITQDIVARPDALLLLGLGYLALERSTPTLSPWVLNLKTGLTCRKIGNGTAAIGSVLMRIVIPGAHAGSCHATGAAPTEDLRS
jgi:hypothetical protein